MQEKTFSLKFTSIVGKEVERGKSVDFYPTSQRTVESQKLDMREYLFYEQGEFFMVPLKDQNGEEIEIVFSMALTPVQKVL